MVLLFIFAAMEAHWFYLPAAVPGLQALDDASARHAVQVLRMRTGDALVVTDGQGRVYHGTVADAGKKSCTVQLATPVQQARQPHRRVGLAVSPLKNAGRFEWLLEKATELGVADIFPLLCHRTVREHFRYERLQAVCISAMLQSQQAWLPVLHQPQSFDALLTQLAQHHLPYKQRWIAHCAPLEKHQLAKAVQPGMTDSLLLIGPEGDFTEQEIMAALHAGMAAVELGPTRLRTETAGVVGTSLLCLLP